LTGVTPTDYRIFVTLGSSFNFGGAASDGVDLRVRGSDGATRFLPGLRDGTQSVWRPMFG